MGRSSTPPRITGERAVFRAAPRRRGMATAGADAGTTEGVACAAAPDSSSNFRNQARTFERARGLMRKPAVSDNQSRLGCGCLWVMISTISPFANARVSGTIRPLTRAGRQVDDLALGGERVDTVFEELGAHFVEKVFVAALSGFEQLAHPFDLAI